MSGTCARRLRAAGDARGPRAASCAWPPGGPPPDPNRQSAGPRPLARRSRRVRRPSCQNFSAVHRASGTIVTSDGYAIEPQITVPQDATDINIASNGEVAVKLPGEAAFQTVGNLELARFINPAGLRTIGRNLMLETQASGRVFRHEFWAAIVVFFRLLTNQSTVE